MDVCKNIKKEKFVNKKKPRPLLAARAIVVFNARTGLLQAWTREMSTISKKLFSKRPMFEKLRRIITEFRSEPSFGMQIYCVFKSKIMY